MPFLKTFQLSMYAQVFLASGMLMSAEGGPAPSALTFVIGLISLIFNDRRHVFGLSEWWANGLALAAFCVASFEFLGDSQEAKLLAGTHLIVYLLWIVLLWKREMRHFWWISALCLLHVALSAVLTQASWFGMVLILYVIVMVWNLTLFSLYRAEQEVVAAPTVIASEKGTALLQAAAGRSPRSSEAHGNVQSDFGVSHIGSRLVMGAVSTSVLGLLVGAMIFVLTPRIWLPAPEDLGEQRSGGGRALRSVTGFTEQVRLGDIGEILESNEPVLTLRVFDNDTEKLLDVIDLANSRDMSEPYLRGAVLVTYEDGTWHPSSVLNTETSVNRAPSRRRRGLIRQEITLEPMGTNLLFAMRPYASRLGSRVYGEIQGSRTPITLQRPSYMLFRESASERNHYRIYCPAADDAESLKEDFEPFRAFSWRAGAELSAPPGPRLVRLKTLAQRIGEGVDQQSLRDEDRTLAVARALESHLRDSGEYGYTLNASIIDPNIDPLEDFLFNRKAGHCEYYAAALTLMLRSVGIPARMINGFKGGDYNDKTDTLRVEQRHAHSWVEAAFGDRWITLDATPSAERDRIVASHKPGFWESLRRGFWQFWNENVVGVSLSRQRREIFEPMLDYLRKAFSSTAGMRTAAVDFWTWFKETVSNPQKWISIDGGILAFLLLGIPAIAFYAARGFWRRMREKWKLRRAAHASSARLVEFYQRFQSLAKRMGYVRRPYETQREFAASLERAIDGAAGDPELKTAGSDIAESFYRVRFGQATLTPQEQQQVDRQLQLLESLAKGQPR